MVRRAVIHPRLTAVCRVDRTAPGYSRVIINEERRRRARGDKTFDLTS